MGADAGQVLPPDPSVPGLWWMRCGEMWRVWGWYPWPNTEFGFWRTGDRSVMAASAHAAGWRCHSPAVPPDKLVEAMNSLQNMQNVLANLSGRTLMDDECLLLAQESVDEVLAALSHAVPREMPSDAA